MSIDFTSDIGKKAQDRLTQEAVIWLTTVSPSETPQPNPVWFVWHAGKVYVMTGPGAAKAMHIKKHSRAAMSFNTDAHGGSVVVMTGAAKVIGQASTQAPEGVIQAYTAKYGPMIPQIMQMNVEEFYQKEIVLEFTPEKLRGM